VTFKYESLLCSFNLITVWRYDFLEQKYRCKSCSKHVDEIDSRKDEDASNLQHVVLKKNINRQKI